MEMEIDRAERFYREAAELFYSLHKDGRRIFGLMMETYHVLLQKIRRQPADVFTRRIRVSRWKKLWLAAVDVIAGEARIGPCEIVPGHCAVVKTRYDNGKSLKRTEITPWPKNLPRHRFGHPRTAERTNGTSTNVLAVRAEQSGFCMRRVVRW